MEYVRLQVANEIADFITPFELDWIASNWGYYSAGAYFFGSINLPIYPVMYTRTQFGVESDLSPRVYKASRTHTLTDFFALLESKIIRIFSWEEFKHLAPMYLAEFSETSTDAKGNTVVKFDHSETEPDDALHSGNIMIALWKALNPGILDVKREVE